MNARNLPEAIPEQEMVQARAAAAASKRRLVDVLEERIGDEPDVYIARLRRKIDTTGREPLLETVRGHGYRLKAPS